MSTEQLNLFVSIATLMVLAAAAILSPTIAIMRRKRGAQLYASFEYLVQRARLWRTRCPNGYTPKGFQRIDNPDVWHDADAVAEAGQAARR